MMLPPRVLALIVRLILAVTLALPMPAMAAPPVPLHPALWRVTGDKSTIYLFGTIHLLPPGTDWLNGAVADAIDHADTIATEIDDPDGSQTRAALGQRYALPPGETLAVLIPPARHAAMVADLARYGLPAGQLEHVKPWYAALTLSMLPLLRRGYDVNRGVEATLAARTATRTVTHVGIESAGDQIGLLDGLPRATQTAYLTTVIDQFGTIDRDIDAMVRAWGNGDAAAIARLMNRDAGRDDPLLTERMITARNRNFAVWIRTRLHQPGVVFVAIGAGHLAGATNVQAVLARAHMRVERVQ